MRSKTIIARALLAVAIVAIALPGTFGVAAQDTVWVPVTFYDFHSDRSNPEFEQPHTGGVYPGMVRETLDSDFKPVFNRELCRNRGVAHWFRDWNTFTGDCASGTFFGKGCTMAPKYTPTPGIRENANDFGVQYTFDGVVDVGHDTSFKNIVIRDQLPFTRTANGMYRFSRTGNTQFFPLDGRGFGNEWPANVNGNPNRNFSFTMEMVYQFEAENNMEFNFSGDDDVWVFVNNRLALDLGGVHGEERGRFNVRDVEGVTIGRQNILRVFYAERHTTQSNITIETNIISPPGSVEIRQVTGPGQTAPIQGSGLTKNADEPVQVTVVVRDREGAVLVEGVDYQCEHITWTVSGPGGYNRTGKGCILDVDDSIAGNLTITAVYQDPAKDAPPVEDNKGVSIRPLEPVCVFIQATPEAKELPIDKDGNVDYAGCGDGRLSDDIYFEMSSSTSLVYAILRDKYGNAIAWEGNGVYTNRNGSSTAQWISDNTDVAMFSAGQPGAQTYPTGSGASITVVKMPAGEGSSGELIVTFTYTDEGSLGGQQHVLTDTVYVGGKREPGVAIGPNPFRPGVDNIHSSYAGTKVPEFYSDVIKNSGNGNGSGILIAVTAPTRLVPVPGRRGSGNDPEPYGNVTIYDAVGNVVHTDYVYKAQYATSYGYVWDGKNNKGRYVGPGTYLVRIAGRAKVYDDAGRDTGRTEAFQVQRKVGVTKK